MTDEDTVLFGGWLARFEAVLIKAEAPVLVEVSQTEFKEKALKGLLGGARISTIRARVRAAEMMIRWLEMARGRP